MNSDWQSLTAVLLVIITASIFLIRMLRTRKNRSCGGCGSCGNQMRK
jgi:hypothetical protein